MTDVNLLGPNLVISSTTPAAPSGNTLVQWQGDGQRISAYIPMSSGYTLPPATASVLGGVKIGANVSVAGDGTISVVAPVNADWNATSGLPQILNKPPITYVSPTTTVASQLAASDVLTVSSANTAGTVLNLNNTTPTTAHNISLVASDTSTSWFSIKDTTTPQTLLSITGSTSAARSSIIKLPSGGVIGWASDNNTPATLIEVGLQRSATQTLQVSDTNGIDLDLRCRAITASGNANVTGTLTVLGSQTTLSGTMLVQNTAGTNYIGMQLGSMSGTASSPTYIRASPGATIYFDTNPVTISGGMLTTGAITASGIIQSNNGRLAAQAPASGGNPGDLVLFNYGATQYLQLIAPGAQSPANPHPYFYSSSGQINVACAMAMPSAVFTTPANLVFGSGFISWTITLAAPATLTGTQFAWYLRMGPIVFIQTTFNFSVAGSALASLTVNLPVNQAGYGSGNGTLEAECSQGSWQKCIVSITTTNTLVIYAGPALAAFPVGSYEVRINGWYRCA